jgi:hypothetical protein
MLHQLLLGVQQALRLLLGTRCRLTTATALQKVLEEIGHLGLLALGWLLRLLFRWDRGGSGSGLGLVDVFFEKFRVFLNYYLLFGCTLDGREGNGLVVGPRSIDLNH